MMIVPSNVTVHLALGVTDMRKGIDGLATLAQEVLKKDPFCGHVLAFRGQRANLIKLLFWDGTGLCLFTKRIDRGHFVWPRISSPGETIPLSPAKLAMLLEALTGDIRSASGDPQMWAEKRLYPAEILGFSAPIW